MSIDSRVLIDTNILVFSIDLDSEKHEIAKELVKKHCLQGTAVLSAQNLAEFVFVVTEKTKKLSAEEANLFVHDLMDNSNVITYSGKEVVRASQLTSKGLHFFDALIVATMENAKVFTILTDNDRDFKKASGIEVINPFR